MHLRSLIAPTRCRVRKSVAAIRQGLNPLRTCRKQHLLIRLPIHLLIRPPIHRLIRLPIRPPIHLLIRLLIRLLIHLLIHHRRRHHHRRRRHRHRHCTFRSRRRDHTYHPMERRLSLSNLDT